MAEERSFESIDSKEKDLGGVDGSLDALKYSLAQQGININVINNAYDTYHNWDY